MVRDQPLCYGDKTANKSVSSDKVHGEDGLEGLPADIAILESPFIDTEKLTLRAPAMNSQFAGKLGSGSNNVHVFVLISPSLYHFWYSRWLSDW